MILAFLTALIVSLVRVALFHAGRPAEGTDFLLVHFLAIATVVFFTDKALLQRDQGTGMAELLRDGFKSAAVYALLTGAFLLFYYNSVEPDHFSARIQKLVELGVAEGQPREVIQPRMEKFFTPFNYASITFFSLLVVGAFNALFIGLLHHKMLRRVMQ